VKKTTISSFTKCYFSQKYPILMTRLESISFQRVTLTPRCIFTILDEEENCTALAHEECNLRELVLVAKLMPRYWQSISKSKHRKVPRYISWNLHNIPQQNLHAQVRRVQSKWRTSSCGEPHESQLQNCSQVQGWSETLTAIDASPDVSMSNIIIYNMRRDNRRGIILRRFAKFA